MADEKKPQIDPETWKRMNAFRTGETKGDTVEPGEDLAIVREPRHDAVDGESDK